MYRLKTLLVKSLHNYTLGKWFDTKKYSNVRTVSCAVLILNGIFMAKFKQIL